jgi:hypothetical protein
LAAAAGFRSVRRIVRTPKHAGNGPEIKFSTAWNEEAFEWGAKLARERLDPSGLERN